MTSIQVKIQWVDEAEYSGQEFYPTLRAVHKTSLPAPSAFTINQVQIFRVEKRVAGKHKVYIEHILRLRVVKLRSQVSQEGTYSNSIDGRKIGRRGTLHSRSLKFELRFSVIE